MESGKFTQARGTGFSMVELLVATAITLIGLLVITQVFAVYEGWKRTTTGVAQGQEAGLLAAFSIEKDLRNAGFGMVGLRCALIKAFNSSATGPIFSLPGMPVTITQDSPVAGSDKIEVVYSSSPLGNVSATLQADMPLSSADLHADQGIGFDSGNLVVVFQDTKDCSLVQLTQNAQAIGTANVTGPGSSWNFPHVPGVWNPPAGMNIFPAGGYSTGAKILNLGRLVDHSYYVADNTLRMDIRDPVTALITSYDLIPGVVGLRAAYGRDINDDGVLDVFDNDTVNLIAKSQASSSGNTLNAIRFSLIVRSGNWERDPVSPASIDFWPGETLALDADARHYRYRVFQTIVPLKNILWNN